MRNKLYEFAFGETILSENEERLYSIMNNSLIVLSKSLPCSMQNQAILFMLEYSNTPIGEIHDFFKNFYKPIWTVIPNISGSKCAARGLTEEELGNAITGQAMALFLHSLDDHLNDGQLSPSHLLLLIRSQAWQLFNKTIEKFPNRTETAQALFNQYYEGISSPAIKSLDQYCDNFRKEMSTVCIVPALAAKAISEGNDFSAEIIKMTGDFGTAWRLLDDIQDIEDDIEKGEHSAVYLSLTSRARCLWDAAKSPETVAEIFRELSAGRIIECLGKRIAGELAKAAGAARELGMHGLASQYTALGAPVEEWMRAHAG